MRVVPSRRSPGCLEILRHLESGHAQAHRVNVPSLSESKYSRFTVFPEKTALEIVPGGAFSSVTGNVKVSPSQCVKANVRFFGPIDSCSAPSRSVTTAGPQYSLA